MREGIAPDRRGNRNVPIAHDKDCNLAHKNSKETGCKQKTRFCNPRPHEIKLFFHSNTPQWRQNARQPAMEDRVHIANEKDIRHQGLHSHGLTMSKTQREKTRKEYAEIKWPDAYDAASIKCPQIQRGSLALLPQQKFSNEIGAKCKENWNSESKATAQSDECMGSIIFERN